MTHNYEPDVIKRCRRKYYHNLRRIIEETEGKVDRIDSGVPKLSDPSDGNDIYGIISKGEFESILEVYDKLPQGQEGPIKCTLVRGESFAKLLFSKTGFHNPGSSQYLINRLGIKDTDRNSYLGGYSNYDIKPELSVNSLLNTQQRLDIREKAKQIYARLSDKERVKDDQDMRASISEMTDLGDENGDALAIRGKWSIRNKNYDQAVEELEAALKHDCWDPIATSKDLSEAYSEIGHLCIARNQYSTASEKFSWALKYNANNDLAKTMLEICVTKQAPRPFGTNPNSFSTRRK